MLGFDLIYECWLYNFNLLPHFLRPSRNCNSALRENWLRCIWATCLHSKWSQKGDHVYILVRFLQTWVNQLCSPWKWDVLNTNILKFCSGGRGCSSLPFTSCSVHLEQCATRVPLWWVKASVVVGIVRHFRGWSCHLHLSSAVWWLRGAKQQLPCLTACMVLREHCGSSATSWAATPLLPGHHVGVTEEWVRNRMWQSWQLVLASVTKGRVQYHTQEKNFLAGSD